MNDSTEEGGTVDRVPSIVGPDGRVPKSLRNAKAKQEANDQRPATVAEVREWITAGSIASMKLVYDQLTEENSKLLEGMELEMIARIERRFEERTIRFKVTTAYRKLLVRLKLRAPATLG